MTSKGTSPYSLHPSIAYRQSILANLEANSGRSLEEWLSLVRKKGPKDEKTIREWLRRQGLGGTQTSMVAERAMGKGEEDTPEGYLKAAVNHVEVMFSGKKAALRPLYDALLKLGFSLGKDVKACPCKTIVPLYRNHVFAQIKPSTNTRIDFGLALKNTKAKGHLIDTGGHAKKDRITHRIEVKSLANINDELKAWLKNAYEMDLK